LTGLNELTTYYVRAYATNSAGTGYGSEVSFATITIPTLTTATITDISYSSATSGGNITANGGSSVTDRGICWNTTGSPDISDSKTSDGSGNGSFVSYLSGLGASTTYYVRSFATTAAGTGYGDQKQFETLAAPTVPALSISSVRDIHSTYATVDISINSDGGYTVTDFRLEWSLYPDFPDYPWLSDNYVPDYSVTTSLGPLQPNTTYYVRCYATTSIGTGYSETKSFTTLP
jgi:hypothetical protein